MKQQLDVDNWNRKEQHFVLKQFEEPFLCNSHNRLHQSLCYRKRNTDLVFIYYSPQNVRSGKSYRCFKYRIAEDNVYVYDQINASATIGRAERYFGFSLIEYDPDYVVLKKCNNRIGRIQTTTGLLRTLEHKQ
jgi:chloramphenicol O-acetyltransferase type A